MTDRTEYQKLYMREWRSKRKAEKGPTALEKAQAGHRAILALVSGRDTPIAKSIRKLAEDALL